MSKGSGAGLNRVPNQGPLLILSSVVANGVGNVYAKEARGFAKWTFQLDPNGTTVNATISVFGSADVGLWGGTPPTNFLPGTAVPAGFNADLLGVWNVNGTGPFNPITYLFPLAGVYAAVTNWVSGTISVSVIAVP